MSCEIKAERAMFTYAFLSQNRVEAAKRNNRLAQDEIFKKVDVGASRDGNFIITKQ